MTTLSIPSKLSTRTSIKGLSLVEVLAALAIGMAILGATFAIVSGNRQLVTTDQLRTSANQNTRSALDIIGTDIRIAGERLNARSNIGISAIEVIGGTELVLRRNLLNSTLPFCDKKLQGNSNEPHITVSLMSDTGGIDLDDYPACRVVDANSDGFPDNYKTWSDYRVSQGSKVRAYIFTPTGKGEFFNYIAEQITGNNNHKQYRIEREIGKWQNTYLIEEMPAIIMLEEKRYKLSNGVLEVTVNGDSTNVQKMAGNISDFQVRAVMADGTTRTALGSSDDWSSIQAVEITIKSSETSAGKTIERSLTSRFFPRNALSN